jgi:hypothetical protein
MHLSRKLSYAANAVNKTKLGAGVVKSLGGFACGPVGLVHTQNCGIKCKKPTSLCENGRATSDPIGRFDP